MTFHVDFTSDQSIYGIADSWEKISNNLDKVEPLKTAITQRRDIVDSEFSVTSVYGRWIIVYTENKKNREETRMYFFDFKFDLRLFLNKLFPGKMVESIIDLQLRYDRLFKDKLDTAELTLSEIYETIVDKNIFACELDAVVLEKAEKLGVLPILQSLKDNALKICLADEIESNEYYHIKNLYALIRFDSINEQKNMVREFAYIKLRDVNNNVDKINIFIKKLEQTGVQFDRVSVVQRFDKVRLN